MAANGPSVSAMRAKFESGSGPSKPSKETPPPSVSSLRNRFEQGSRSNSSKSMHQVMKQGGSLSGKGGSVIVKSSHESNKPKMKQPGLTRGGGSSGQGFVSDAVGDGGSEEGQSKESTTNALTITFSGPSSSGEKGKEKAVEKLEKLEKVEASLELSCDGPAIHNAASASENSVAMKGEEAGKGHHGVQRQKRRPMSMYSSVGRSVTASEKANMLRDPDLHKPSSLSNTPVSDSPEILDQEGEPKKKGSRIEKGGEDLSIKNFDKSVKQAKEHPSPAPQTSQPPSKQGGEQGLVSLTARLLRRKDKSKSIFTSSDQPTYRGLSAYSPATPKTPPTDDAPIEVVRGRSQTHVHSQAPTVEGQIDDALSQWLGQSVKTARSPPGPPAPSARGKKKEKSKLGECDEFESEGMTPSFLGKSLNVSERDSGWHEEDIYSVDVDAMTLKERADHFVGAVEDKEPSPNFTLKQPWPPFNPLGEYKGDLRDGLPHGLGELYFPNGRKYLGEWKVGRRDGQGKMYWPCGNVYVGEFKDDKRHGKGVERSREHGVLSATWQHGKLDGRGSVSIPGCTLSVEWSKGRILSVLECKM